MNRTVYVNGEYLPEESARISVFDRGFLFADGVYEVTSVLRGKLVDNAAHLARLERSMSGLGMTPPAAPQEIEAIQQKLVALNGIDEGLVYLQVTRGAADRDFVYPTGAAPSLVMFTQKLPLIDRPQAKVGLKVVSVPDIRWKRRDIKTVGLLAASMAKMQAKSAGADDAWMVEEGFVTEGSSNNAYIVDQEGNLITRQLGTEILAGITRRAVLQLADETRLNIVERPFTIAEACAAREAFVTSATTFVMPVVSIDGQTIADGVPGDVTRRLREIYISTMLESIA